MTPLQWRPTIGGYTSAEFTIRKNANTRTNGHDGVTWSVFRKGIRIAVQPTLEEAKQSAEAARVA